MLFHGEQDGFGFCPAKLFRDDHAFILYVKRLFVTWKTGSGFDTNGVSAAELDDLYFLLRHWEKRNRQDDFNRLAFMFGGGPDTKKPRQKDER